MYSRRYLFNVATALCVAVTISGTGRTYGQAARSKPDRTSLISKGEEKAKQVCEAVIKTQRDTLLSAGSLTSFRAMAKDMISWSEKIAQGEDLLRSGSRDSQSRIRSSFRKHVLDDAGLPKQFSERFEKLQQDLIRDTLHICRTAGCSESRINITFHRWKFNHNFGENAFDVLIRRARSISESDWMREILVYVGSDLANDAVEATARKAGLWNLEEGSWADAIAGMLTEALINEVIHEVSDPAGDIAKNLRGVYQAIVRQLIDGEQCFADACRTMTQHHIDGRRKLLGIRGKEVK